MYRWLRQARPSLEEQQAEDLAEAQQEIKRLKGELTRTREKRDIQKKGRGGLHQGPRLKYAFVRNHRGEHRVATMCGVLGITRSGFYAESGGVYGSPRIFKDLREIGETCSLSRVARWMRKHNIKAVRG